MDLVGPALQKILTPAEVESIPVTALEKIKNYLDELCDDYCKEKAAASRLGEYEQRVEEYQSQIGDLNLKLTKCQQSNDEMSQQLERVSQERTQLMAVVSAHEAELAAMRNEKKQVAEDRDSLMKVIERQSSELERLRDEMHSYQQQLNAAIAAKCEALTRCDEVDSKEAAVEFRERRMEQERSLMENQIKVLTDDLNRKMTELNNLRREHSMQSIHVEARLDEKIEELRIANTQNVQYKETINQLTDSIQELSKKLHAQSEDSNRLMDYYKKELDAKTKLSELYKSNSEDTDSERNELSQAVADLKRMLTEASEQYGQLETKHKATLLQHEQEMEEKEKETEALRTEIKHANELLREVQDANVESTIAKIAPSAAHASRLIKSDMSLTQVYTLYVSSSEECELQKRENARLQLQLKAIMQELNESAPNLQRIEIEYAKLLETNKVLSHQRNELLAQKEEMVQIWNDAVAQIEAKEREIKRLSYQSKDLRRQLVFLLKQKSKDENGHPAASGADVELSDKFTADELLSKTLVTYSNVEELQANNTKLLMIVRDLTEKAEQAELQKHEEETKAINRSIEKYAKKVQEIQEACNQQNTTIATLVKKCDRYKKMYFEASKSGKTLQDVSDEDEAEDAANVEMKDAAAAGAAKEAAAAPSPVKGKRVAELERLLAEANEKYGRLKEQHEYYIKEKTNNERILNEQFDSMRTEVRELTSTNCKLSSSVEYTKEQIKLQQKNITTYKQQIVTLEERNKNYESTIVKHEQTVQYLKDEIMKVHQTNASTEVELNHLRQENRILKDSVARLQDERNVFNKNQHHQDVMLTNLEMIKTNLERSEMEGRARLEGRLDDTLRELSAQRRRFQEEEDRFREAMNDMKRQTDGAKQAMEEEKLQADKLREELVAARDQLQKKSEEIDSLSKKLQESLMPSKTDNPIAVLKKRVRELEHQLEAAQLEIKSLSGDVEKQRSHAEQYHKMSQSAETEIKSLHEVHTAFVAKAEAEIKQLRAAEHNLRARITELESEVQLTSIAQMPMGANESDKLAKTRDELKDALEKLNEYSQTVRQLRTDNASISEALIVAERKYSNEMMQHSADIQELTRIKEAYTKMEDQLNGQQAESEAAKAAFETLRKANEETQRMFETEKRELEERIKEINSLNSSLHDQIEALTSRLTALSQNTSLNESKLDVSMPDLNRSGVEEDQKNHDQLLQIIKYLRKEKDLLDAKMDIIRAEKTRLMSENSMLQNKNDELQGFLNQERSKSQTAQVSAARHGEILRKIETMNALTDSNRILREERNTFAERVKELTERISTLEKELVPLQTQNRELSTRVDELTTETSSLRLEAVKWRQRANVLIDKNNKNPEEFKRLQMERESLAKMLTADKENIRKLNENIEALTTEKSRLEAERSLFEKQLQQVQEEKKKLSEDGASAKQNYMRVIQEVMDLKNQLLNKEESLHNLTQSLEDTKNHLKECTNREVTLRKIAKKYKDAFLEAKENAASGAASGDGPAGGSGAAVATSAGGAAGGSEQAALENSELAANPAEASANAAELEQYRNTIEELNQAIAGQHQENETLRQQIQEVLAASASAEESANLSKCLAEELEKTKAKLLDHMNARENHELFVNNLRSQHEEAIGRLTREIESLQMRINQLTRQQQTSKPSTSSGVMSEKGCISESPRTANVKPMSGSASSGQQSATVTPWRGSETPLASIRPITVQNTRTAAVMPTSQQPNVGGTTSSTSASNSNTALVPPQQQVHTTGPPSTESMSSSPTSSHTDYMPSTSSSTSVAVAAIPPMASTSAESSQEAESMQQQQSDSQLLVSGGSGGAQQQVVALVSPRVEGSSTTTTTTSQAPVQQEPSNQQQPSTSGSSSFTPHISVSSHIRHTPSSSSVTTSQAGSSGAHKRPREDHSPSTNDDELLKKHPKLMRVPLGEGEGVQVLPTDSEIEYQVPTSSQRDQEDDIVVVDSDADDGMVEADDGPADGDGEHEGYEDSYEQDAEVDETEAAEGGEVTLRAADMEVDNNEVDVDECNQVHQSSSDTASDPSTSQAAAELLDNRQQSHTISSGSSDTPAAPSNPNAPWMQASSSASTTLTRQQKATLKLMKAQGSEVMAAEEEESKTPGRESNDESDEVFEGFQGDDSESAKSSKQEDVTKSGVDAAPVSLQVDDESEGEFQEEVVADGTGDNESESKDPKADVSEVQQSSSEDNEANDTAVSSEGEKKQSVEEPEEEGREAEASTSNAVTTRSKTSKNSPGGRGRGRGYHRGARPVPIVWQNAEGGPGNSRQAMMNMQQRGPEQPGNARGGYPNQRATRGRRMRRPTGGNFPNMRFS